MPIMNAKLLSEKINEVSDFLNSELPKYQRPVLNCSFGKDSLVLLHLLKFLNLLPQIVFYRDPWFPKKYDFAHWLIAEWNLEVYDYPPIATSMLYGKGIPAFVNEYQTSEWSKLVLPKNIIEFQEGDDERQFLCGVNFFTRPCGTFAYPWDVALVAHKDVDQDQIYGEVPLRTRVLFSDVGPDFIYPLKDWSDEDVWDYLEHFKVPIQTDRYDVANRCEWPDKTTNSDYWPACIRCVDKRLEGETVFCPKLQKEIKNVSDLVQEFTHQFDYFGVKEE